jgi:hypothetical protein
MNHQSSTDYDVDNRYRGAQGASDNNQGKRAAAKALAQRRRAQRSSQVEDSKEDGRFIVSGPGDSTYSFKNAYGAPRSPTQRRLERLNQ